MSRRVTVIVAGVCALALALAGCGSNGGSDGSGGKVSSIKLVAAEYSKEHTAAFWNAFAAKYQAKTGIKLEVQVVSWNDIDQQSSTMIQNSRRWKSSICSMTGEAAGMKPIW